MTMTKSVPGHIEHNYYLAHSLIPHITSHVRPTVVGLPDHTRILRRHQPLYGINIDWVRRIPATSVDQKRCYKYASDGTAPLCIVLPWVVGYGTAQLELMRIATQVAGTSNPAAAPMTSPDITQQCDSHICTCS